MANRHRPIPHTAISFPCLIRHLSQPPYLPSSLAVRNKLLRSYTFPQPWSGFIPDPDPWDTFLEGIGQGGGVWAFGEVPHEVLNDEHECHAASALRDVRRAPSNEVWAIAVLTSELLFGSTSPSAPIVPRLYVWFSSEGELDRYDTKYNKAAQDALCGLSAGRNAEDGPARDLLALLKSEQALFEHIAFRWLPATLNGLRGGDAMHISLRVLFCDLPQRLSTLLVTHADNVPSTAGGGDTPMVLHIDFNYSCVLYVRSSLSTTEPLRVAADSGWSVGELAEDDVEFVQQTNEYFPTSYVQSHRCISSAVRRSSSARTNGLSTDPSDLPGGPVGWCYAHDVLSVASLHTVPAMRRQKIAVESHAARAESPPSAGVARLVLSDFERKARAAQWQALRCSGAFGEHEVYRLCSLPSLRTPSLDPAAIVAVSVLPNDAMDFLEHVGFLPSHGVAWTQVIFQSPDSSDVQPRYEVDDKI